MKVRQVYIRLGWIIACVLPAIVDFGSENEMLNAQIYISICCCGDSYDKASSFRKKCPDKIRWKKIRSETNKSLKRRPGEDLNELGKFVSNP